MPNIILFDGPERVHLLPIAFTRPVCNIRIGILTIKEKWEKLLPGIYSYSTETYLSKKYASQESDDNIWINGSVLPSQLLLKEIHSLKTNQGLTKNEQLIAIRVSEKPKNYLITDLKEHIQFIESKAGILKINHTWDIFRLNGEALLADYELLTKHKKSQNISSSNTVLGEENIFLEPGAKVECATLNAQTGPIYIGKEAEIMEGVLVRGPFALCEQATLKMGAKIYGPTTIGPQSKVGGEVNNSVIIGYSNKAHDGFLGNSVIGEWCNLGADTNNSNLKNNYTEVKIWDYASERFIPTGLQFCGLIMGDHSKSGINTMFNTGTVVGVSANIFGSGFPRNYIPSFSWGGAQKLITYKIEKALEVAGVVMKRRGIKLDEMEKDILKHIADLTASKRK